MTQLFYIIMNKEEAEVEAKLTQITNEYTTVSALHREIWAHTIPS